MMHRCWIGMGSNLGDRREILDHAVTALGQLPDTNVCAVSPYWENAPIGGPSGQNAFLNAVGELSTRLTPENLAHELRNIESQAGRVRLQRWGARTLDLDVLLFDQIEIHTETLTIPHPRMTARRFVLAPLVHIAPDVRDPITGLTAAELLANIDRTPRELIIPDQPALAVAITQALPNPRDWRIRDFAGDLSNLVGDHRPTFLAYCGPKPHDWRTLSVNARLDRVGWNSPQSIPILWPEADDPAGQLAELLAACAACGDSPG